MTTQTMRTTARGVSRVLVTAGAATLLVTVVLSGVLESTAGAAGPPYATKTTVTSSVNPSVSGQPLTFTAKVMPSGTHVGSPTGTVEFAGAGACASGVTLVSGVATCHVPLGLTYWGQPFTVTATYEGAGNFSSSSGSVVQTVTQAHATISLAVSPGTCSSATSCTEIPGTPFTLTATTKVKAPTVGYVAGPIVFKILPAGQTTSLPCEGGNSVMAASGVATCTLAAGLPASIYTVATATLEDPNFVHVKSTLSLNANLLSTSTTLKVPSDVTAGESFDVRAYVKVVGTTSPTRPTGEVAISVCVAPNGSRPCKGTVVPLQANGSAVLQVQGGEFAGQYEAYARYLGDQNYWGSTAANIPADTFTVAQTPTALAISSDGNPSVSGSPVNLTTTLTASNGAAESSLVGPPTGTLTYTITDPNDVSYMCQGGNTFTIRDGHVEGAFTCYLPPGVLLYEGTPPSTAYTVTVSYSGDANYLPSTAMFDQDVVPPES